MKKGLKRNLILFIALIILIGAFVFELLLDFSGFDLLKNYFWAIGAIGAIFVIGPLKNTVSKLADNKQKEETIPTGNATQATPEQPPESTVFEKALSMVSKGFEKLLPMIVIYIVICLCVLGISVSAHFHVYGWAFEGAKNVFETMMPSHGFSESNTLVESDQDEDEKEGDDDNDISYVNEPLIDEPSGKTDVTEDQGLGEFLLEPDRFQSLSQEEHDWLFLTYFISDWTDTKSMVKELLPFLQDLVSQERDAKFNTDTSEPVKAIINEASVLENTLASSADLDKVISIRESVWNEGYESFSIAYLIENNMQRYGLEYLRINGQFKTVEYYYGYSIFWGWRSLTFKEIDQKTFKKSLLYIAMRYHDIAYAAPNGGQMESQATAMYDALNWIANNVDLRSVKEGVATIS